jgi:hypothetical protein
MSVACHLEVLRLDGLPVPPPRAHFTMVDHNLDKL